MLEIPLRCLMPNGRLPALNDSEEMAPPLSLYEVASARYGDRFFQNVIAGSQRGGLDAFLIGSPKPLKQKTVLTSMILLDSGIAILRKRDQYIALDFGQHGGYHGHYDKLALNFFTAGIVIGIVGYGGVAQVHAMAYGAIPFHYGLQSDTFKIVGVADNNPKARDIATQETKCATWTTAITNY